MKQLVFATHNLNKAIEINKLLGDRYKILTLDEIGCMEDIPETGKTFEDNAALKSQYVVDHFKIDCFADDSGLEVDALNNEPGIYSARYSGERDDFKNLSLVLRKLEGVKNRKARFKTVICLSKDGKNHYFAGVINGNIRNQASGTNGFGYDPIFEPEGYNITFAEMELTEKNAISHRAIAVRKLIAFLKENGEI